MNKTDSPQGFVLDMYKQANLPLLQERLFGELSGRDVMMYNRVWTYLEGSMTFAATALQAIAFFVKDVALTILALIPAIVSSDARRFVEVHVAHMLQDLVAIPVGIIGFVSPHAGTFLAKTSINLFISLFQDNEAEEGEKSIAEDLHDFNGEFVEATALGVHLMAQLNSFDERKAALAKEQTAFSEGEFDEEACGAIQQRLIDLKSEKQAWIKDHAEQIRQARKGLFEDVMPKVPEGDDDVGPHTPHTPHTHGGFDGSSATDPLPQFAEDFQAVRDAIWSVANQEQDLDDLMCELERCLCGNNVPMQAALQDIIQGQGSAKEKGRALTLAIQEFMPELFGSHV